MFTKTINRYYFVEFPKFSLQLTTPFAELFHNLFLLFTWHSTWPYCLITCFFYTSCILHYTLNLYTHPPTSQFGLFTLLIELKQQFLLNLFIFGKVFANNGHIKQKYRWSVDKVRMLWKESFPSYAESTLHPKV